MRVIKRSGIIEDVKFDKVTNRISKLRYDLSENVDASMIAKHVFSSMYDNITTHEIDTLSAEICVGMITSDPDYEILATRIVASNIQKTAPKKFSEAMRILHEAGIITDEIAALAPKVDEVIDPERDFMFGYFGIKTLERGYLMKMDGVILETPQYMYMRVALGIHGEDVQAACETYHAMSSGACIHATPTLFNAGTHRPQMSSCFAAGTPVFTTNRGPVPIEDVRLGDTVITHTGATKPVVQTHKNPLGNRTLFDVKVYKTPGFQVTDNHKFWSLTKEQLKWKESPQWNSMEHLRVGDWISIPRSSTPPPTEYQVLDLYEVLKDEKGAAHWEYSFEFNGTKMRRNTFFTSEYRPNGIKKTGEWFERYVTIDEHFAWFIGSWYGDGSIMYQKTTVNRTQTHCGIAIAQDPNNTEFIEEIKRIGEKYLGIHACISRSKKQNCLSISFSNSAIGNAFNILFGRWSSEKFLWPTIFSWSRPMVSALIGGLVSTDGCCTINGSVVLQLTNKSLMTSLFHVTRSVGIDTSLTIMHKPYRGDVSCIGRMQIPWIPEIMKWVIKYYSDDRLQRSERVGTTIEFDGRTFLRINDKVKVTDNLPSHVYTLGVEDDHSYSVQGLIAENCFLASNKSDSIDGIYDTLKECAQISKWAGGIGLHIHDVRANKSPIKGTNGQSDGIIPMMRVYNATARYVNQAGRRKGSIAMYIEPWHADIMDFLDIRLNQGDEEARCRDLFSALWIPDLFMKRVEDGGTWSLFCPNKAKGLSDVYGDAFEALYQKYEREGLADATVPALDIWKAIIKSQSETGTPYMLYKDACNKKSNQKNLGTIKSSNLCSEIVEYSDADETAVCNLSSIALPTFVKDREFDHQRLHAVTKMITKNLNRVIDRNFYPTEAAKRSNMRHRPIGMGVQGLADVFIMCRMPFGSDASRELNAHIFETMYHAGLEASCELAEVDGAYETFEGSPASRGVLQFDMWDREPMLSGRYDWDAMKTRVKKGLRNSLLLAPMPTASTSQILGNNECFEPYTTNIYLRRTLAGEFVVVNKHLVRDLQALGLWSKEMKDLMIKAGGSVQNITDIPRDIKELYKTVWEISQKVIIDMAADRGVFVDQSQSMNLFVESPTLSKLSSMHMYAWKSGLKTGMYYLRSKAKARPIQFSLEAECTACSA